MADLADDLTPDQPPAEHPIVSVMKGLLGALMPDAQAADQTKMIGGQPYMKMDANGNVSESGIKLKPEEVEPSLTSYIARQQQAIAHNAKTYAAMPGLADNPAMKQINDDMQEQIANAQEILAKVRAKQKPKVAQ